MGNKQSTKMIQLKQHQINSPHYMLNNCKMIITQHNKFLKSSWSFIDKQIYQKWKNNLDKEFNLLFQTNNYQTIINHSISNFLFFPHHHQYIDIGFCSTNGVVNMIYQMVEDSLVKDIQSRSHNNQPYTQNQIWIILYLLIKISTFFHQKGQYIGDIRPQNIFLTQNQKFIKIAMKYSWIGQPSLKQKCVNRQKIFITQSLSKHYLSDIDPSLITLKNNDNFAIGMTLAECILLQDLSTIYQNNNKEIIISKEKHSKIIENLLKVKYYPLKLLIFVIGLIQIDQQHRFTSQEVQNCLDSFKVQILTQNTIIMSRSHLKKSFGNKFDYLYTLLSQYKSNIHNKLFINRQLSLSNAYTINGLSTVQMAKRTYDDTFNIQFLDLSVNQYKTADQNNKSWNSPQQKNYYFVQKSKKSNVLDQLNPNSGEKRQAKSNQKSKKKTQHLKIPVTQSQIEASFTPQKFQKRGRHTSLAPVSTTSYQIDKNPYYQSPELKIFEKKEGQQHFSFHSPQSQIKTSEPAIINSLNKDKICYQSNQYFEAPGEMAESIILSKKISQQPQSYFTYQYSNSKSHSSKKQSLDNENNGFNISNPSNSKIKNQITKMQRQPNIPLQFRQKDDNLQHNFEFQQIQQIKINKKYKI